MHVRVLFSAIAAALGVMIFASAGLGAVREVGALTADGTADTALGPVAASGRVAVALGQSDGVGYVFAEPPTGWSSGQAAAALVDSGGAPAQPITAGVSADTVVLSENPGGATNFDDVFVQPPDGWHGIVNQAARLVASDGAVLYRAAVSGTTVVAVASTPPIGVDDIYVFEEPASGWSGSVQEVARLVDSHGQSLHSVTIDGSTVIAGARDRADVFVEPASGWSGTIHQSATLNAQGFPVGDVGLAGRTALAGDRVFSEPTAGWRGEIDRAAALFPESAAYLSGESAFTGQLAAVTSDALGPQHDCPCTGSAWLFSQPSLTWKGVIAAPATVRQDTLHGALSIAIDRQTLLASGGTDSIAIDDLSGGRFGHPPPPPTATEIHLSGLATGRPTLSLRLQATPTAPRIQAFSLTLPPQLRILRSQLKSQLTINGHPPATAKLRHRRLTVSFDSSHRVAIRFAPGALGDTVGLRRAAFGHRHGRPHHKSNGEIRVGRAALQISDVLQTATHRSVALVSTS